MSTVMIFTLPLEQIDRRRGRRVTIFVVNFQQQFHGPGMLFFFVLFYGNAM